MANRFRVHVLLPPLAADEIGEVTHRKLVRTMNADPDIEEEFGSSETERLFEAVQGDSVNLALFNKDDAGNYSLDSSRLAFLVTDVTPPAVPGGMSVTLEELP